ncbi:MAG TPA: hypothetical protein DCS93_34690 [Microscillaceae bacterium]|nr:hypothetical protein [Microscillaceae bacterium]
MELKHIEYFLALAEELNFSRAAQRLHISQPPLSRHIKALEDELKTKLFYRDTHSVRLTKEGHLFYEKALALSKQVQGVADKVKSANKVSMTQLNISFVFPALIMFLPDLLANFRKSHPHIQIDMKELYDTAEIQRKMENNELDAAFLHNVLPQTKGVSRHRVAAEDIQLVIPIDHPLAKQEEVSHQDLKNERIIFFSRELSPTLYDLFLYECYEAGRFRPNITTELTPAHARIAMVSQGLGVTFAPSSLEKMFRGKVLFKRIIRTKPVVLPIDLAWNSHTTNQHLLEFIKFTQAYFAAKQTSAPGLAA